MSRARNARREPRGNARSKRPALDVPIQVVRARALARAERTAAGVSMVARLRSDQPMYLFGHLAEPGALDRIPFMYFLIEAWTPKPTWMTLTRGAREAYVSQV